MKVKCIANMGTSLAKQSLKAGRTVDTVFHIKVGDVYTVYGMNLWRGTLNYLTMNQANSLPIWSPAELFEVVDGKIPLDWYYVYLGHTEDLLNAAWGYQELTQPAHYDGLQGGDAVALKVFFQKKKAIDAQ
jgi:hypothetical protein